MSRPQTARALARLGAPHARARMAAMLLGGIGAALAAVALGLVLAPALTGITLGWALVVLSLAIGAWYAGRARRETRARVVGRLVESVARDRAGSVVGIVTNPAGTAGTSEALLAAADHRAAAVVARAAPAVDQELRRVTRRRLAAGTSVALAGAALFAIAGPAAGGEAAARRSAFWHPVRAWRDARAPVRLDVDRRSVRRGETVTATVVVPGETRATLWTRGPGEPWRATPLALDGDGRATRPLGPLESELFVRAASGGRSSGVVRVAVSLPAFLAELALTARYPEYLGRGDEPLVAGPDTVLLPVGTVITATGVASVSLASAVWMPPERGHPTGGAGRAVPLRVEGTRLSGRFSPAASGTWRLSLRAADDAPLEDAPPELHIRLVPDSAPVVALPVPGRDTTMPLSLQQQIVADVRDDHGITGLTLVSRRVSRTGRAYDAVRESLDVSGLGDRAIVQSLLDAERRGLLPGDTLRVLVEACDNAPAPRGPQCGRSPEFALRLPSMQELRARTRDAARALVAEADSIAAAQRALGERTRDLAQERNREADGRTGGRPEGRNEATMSFQATQRADEVAREQAAMAERVAQLAQAMEEIARAARAAGVDDTAFQNRLREVQQLLERALSPELEQRLRELQEALARLDPEATRQALQRLAEAQQQLKRELERSQELFRRAAIEGELSSLAKDAEDLRDRQEQWTREDAPRADSAAAAGERDLAARADSLERGLERSAQSLAAEEEGALQRARARAARAAEAMRQAAGAAEQRNARAARERGAEAADSLRDVPDELRRRRDSLAAAWRAETLDRLARALSETAALAQRQRDVAEELRAGQGGPATRARQGAVEEGARAIGRQVSEAAGRHALVPPQLEAALGFAQLQMRQAREQLEQGDPNTALAAPHAEQALDALNATAHALARAAEQVAGAQSGSGFQEALEQLARLANQQQGLTGDAQGLLPLMAGGREAVMQELRRLAARQRELAEQLERLRAEGEASGAGALAEEARELARQMEAGRLDRRTIERQERLYRRLLDAGRSLTGPEPDEQKERTSRSATGDSVRLPGALAPGATGVAPRLRYPDWEDLSRLTPEQRRLVLEYFRRLNEARSQP